MTTLRLTVTSAPPDSTLSGKTIDISVAGTTFGRGPGNQCVLPDGERIVSSKHASITHELGQYVVTDLSTNGTFLNDSPTAIGPNNSAPLKEGDCIAMGKYLFTVSLASSVADKPAAAPTAGSFLDDLGVPPAASTPAPAPDSGGADDLDRWLEPASKPAQPQPLWGASNVVQASPDFEEENDPLAAIDQARRSESPLGGSFLDSVPEEEDPDWWKGSQKDNVDPMSQAFEAPKPVSTPDFAAEPTPVPQIPPPESQTPPIPEQAAVVSAVDDADDLDALLGLDSAPAPASTPASAPAPDQTEPSLLPVTPQSDMSSPFAAEFTEPPAMAEPVTDTPPEPQVEPAAAKAPRPQPPKSEPTPSPAASTGAADTAQVLAQLLELGNLDQGQLDALTPEVVAVLNATIGHLLELLRARSSIKNELRLDRTMIQPVENNPLKFALTDKDAKRYLFGEHSGAYMSGSKAVAEAFNDIAGHQMALLAGMRSAYEKMLAKFSPEALETRFGDAATKGLLSSKKARLWDAYVEYFDKLQQDPETSFNRLFGEEFASAYETQVDDIKSSKPDR